jgi:serine/threonine-protein kinase RsbW
VGSVCERLLPELEASDFSGEEVFGVHLALEEAFLNALRHGNKMDPGKAIRVEYSVDSDRIEISVTDEGEGFDPESVPDPRCGENLYKPDGRGLLLMRSYMDEVRFSERGNCVHMVKYRGEAGAAETSR